MCLIVYSNDHAPLTVRLIYSSSKLRTVQMMIFSLVAMIGLAKCCITSACLQWLCHSGERIVARGPLVYFLYSLQAFKWIFSHLSLGLLMPRPPFVIGPSDAQATSAYISLKVFYSFTNITLPLLRIFREHSSVSLMLLFGRFLVDGGHKFFEFACLFCNYFP